MFDDTGGYFNTLQKRWAFRRDTIQDLVNVAFGRFGTSKSKSYLERILLSPRHVPIPVIIWILIGDIPTPLKNMTSPVGSMKSSRYGQVKKYIEIFQTTNQNLVGLKFT